jgi:hypothetical protein
MIGNTINSTQVSASKPKSDRKSPTSPAIARSLRSKQDTNSKTVKCCEHECCSKDHGEKKDSISFAKTFDSREYVRLPDSSQLLKKKTPPIVAITLTSPDGIDKSLLRRQDVNASRGSSRVRVKGIPMSKSDFWLPSVAQVPTQLPEKFLADCTEDIALIGNKVDQDEKKVTENVIDETAKDEQRSLLNELQDALKVHEFRFVENTKDILQVRTISG